MIRRPPRSTQSRSSAASDVYKRQFLHLIDVGLDNLEHPNYGGWGGRLIQSDTNPNRWEDGEEVAEYKPFTQKMDNDFPQTRWIKALQMDFAARADWCVNSYEDANHAPTVPVSYTHLTLPTIYSV